MAQIHPACVLRVNEFVLFELLFLNLLPVRFGIVKTLSLTGQGGVNPGQVADSMLDALCDFMTQTPQSSLKLVRIVIFQAPMLTDFYQSMQKKEGSDKQKKESSTWTKVTCML